jgi:hypothetical protein
MFATLRQETLLDDHVRDDLVARRIAFRRTVGVLDVAVADRSNKAVQADRQDLADASIDR